MGKVNVIMFKCVVNNRVIRVCVICGGIFPIAALSLLLNYLSCPCYLWC
jgi:hypothetical protein